MCKHQRLFTAIMAIGCSVSIICSNSDNDEMHRPVDKSIGSSQRITTANGDGSVSSNRKSTGNTDSLIPCEMPDNQTAQQGELLTVRNGKKMVMPLITTDVKGSISGFLARINVTQTFVNALDTTIEAIYTFPLPENSAVDSMIMTVGSKRIKGVIKKREEAREIYDKAKKEGRMASLLEQERPNIFTQSIATVQPGDTVTILISYVQEVAYQNGNYKFNFPMVVGPRYIPGTAVAAVKRGTENPTNQVPDAHLITPPLIVPDTRCGNDITLNITINAGCPLKKIACESHKIEMQQVAHNGTNVSIMANDRIPNKDFILEYRVADNSIKNIVLTHRTGDEGFLQLVMVPQYTVEAKQIFARELVFVVDNSGSMGGQPIEKCKEIMRKCLTSMRQDDMFRVIKFAGSTEILSEQPLVASKINISRALAFVDNMNGGGGTEMMKAINAIFATPETSNRKRLVLFMTDGYIGNEKEILSTIRSRLGSSRVFGLGVGSSVNRYLLEGMSAAGRGVCTVIRHDGDAAKATEAFYTRIDAPIITDITVTTNEMTLFDQQPVQLPDLFFGHPLVLTAKYRKPSNGSITITGKLPDGKKYKETLLVKLPKKQTANGVLPTLWARRKIAEVSLQSAGYGDSESVSSEHSQEVITELGLQYKIMTQYTSFVAVDDAVRDKQGGWITVEQAVPLPEGTSANGQPPHRFTGSNTMNKILRSIQSSKAGGSGSVGRKGVAGIGYGAGYGGGFGGSCAGSIDDLLGGLNMKKRGSLKVNTPSFTKGGNLTGGRSKASVMRVLMQNMASLRYQYNKLLRTKPDAKGNIVVKFGIDEFGKVLYCTVVSSTMNDKEFEAILCAKLQTWKFDKIDKPGDVTEVVYPFVFSK